MSRRMLVAILIGIVAIALLKQYAGTENSPAPQPTATASAPSSIGSLPQEAVDTIALIQSDGPFPYRQDGAVFMNRERRLPAHGRGYWREYTVTTPGESDRGARRIVHGEGDEYYYTDDHYGSFERIHPPKLVK
ncbi:ribonuclease T1 [Aeromicrobium panaciterrae]|uniref:Ribonuclease T1 n=1 Tax=Aeromicrobium panaciterrae TaxID=363861 RepID=A0ABU1UPQ9_9ACTN|nr:ribonuclease domain-containing protein [Aeromicrobium panaciterrae]MDR7087173.1 ribonuclease T1 [Aeromicrobium panaciterrae]